MLKMFMTGDNAFEGTREVCLCSPVVTLRMAAAGATGATTALSGLPPISPFGPQQDLKRYLDKKAADDELKFENNMYALP